MSNEQQPRSFVPRTIRRLALPILLFWVGLAALTNIAVPQLEDVGKTHNVALNSPDAPSLKAIKRIGEKFHEFDTDSSAMIVLEGDKPLGADAHRFYDEMIRKIERDKKHVQHVQDYWGDTLTAAGSQSSDGKAAYVQVNLAGNQGSALANEGVGAIRDIVEHMKPPPGVKTYVTGAAPLISDQFDVGSKGTAKVTGITVGVIAVMLFFVYRSVLTTLLVLATVLIEMSAARGLVAFLGNAGVIGLSTYATNLLTLLVIAAGTDYAIFFVGRYQEARGSGEDRETAFYTMYHGTTHIVLGSGLTVAGAVACLSFTRLPYFQSLGVPAALGILVALFAALTLGPAILTLGAKVGIFDPKRAIRTRGWRRIGTAIVRWPGAVLASACALALVGLLALPGYKTSYDTRPYMPASAPANIGYTAAEKHFSRARLEPELLMVETDHDMRNPESMLILDKVAKAVFHVPGIAQVQSITRPLGTPLVHSSLAFVVSNQSAAQQQNLTYQRDRADDALKQANELTKTINILKQQYVLQQQLAGTTHEETESFRDTLGTIRDLRDKIANFDDFFRPVRSYFYWEKHCYDIPACFAFRSLFDAIDGIDQLTEKFENLTASLDKLDALQPKLTALIPPQIESQQTNRDLTLANYATLSGIYAQTAAAIDNATALGRAFDAAKNDDTFYLPPEVFNNPDFKRGLKLFLSPDGKAARMIVTHEGDPATPEGISHIDPMAKAAHEALKGTPMAGAQIYLGGTAATYKDIQDGAKYDLMIVAFAALSLILLIMMIITRSLIAALVIVGTVALSLGASFGLSVLVWQYIFGIQLYWVVLALAVILLLAVGSDYNLLLISRFKEEIRAGINTGIIRAMAGSGSVVTSAGVVFAVTMCAFVFSGFQVLGQIGTTIGLGLLFDTLIVRSFMTPSVARLLGRWFWWPQRVRPRPASTMLRPYGSRPAVRQLLLWEDDDPVAMSSGAR
ncbi:MULTISPECIES: MMPL/RND family transporter [Mycobacterium]|uniref:Membrane protein n=2 Tax=Mycobacterium avium complex (MAC) TaxID=120793 RepID=A0ABN6AGS7_9MYCO|nr:MULTISPECIES: MMPL family transporter [Mycobacterium]AFC55315.1 putative transmembrane transport protein [Mycobacterium paraintracellulare]AFS15749.1 Putative membrane protein mmpL4 [Mycobacterium intracellulare subsp. intracellulare MTCC 9506]OSC30996.1 MMPL family RND transporter [Mycobacterium paraintracellulare]WSE52832.1 MMPL family transporter [Mycobacterium sp. 2-64]BBY68231.1 membrane protein [Mycobacterium paraintracellulare]